MPTPRCSNLTDQGENTGSELVSGQYFASVDFAADGMTSDELDALAVDNAVRSGWEVARIDEFPYGFPYGRETWLRCGTLVAELHISLERVEGEFHVREDRSATFGLVVFLVGVAPVALLTTVALVSLVKDRRR